MASLKPPIGDNKNGKYKNQGVNADHKDPAPSADYHRNWRYCKWYLYSNWGAGISVLYCLILSLCYKSINFKSFSKILVSSACTSGIILFLISASSAMSFVMAYSGIPAAISTAIMSVSSNKYVILLLMNVILLVIGMFMDITPAILIFTPISFLLQKALEWAISSSVLCWFLICVWEIWRRL